MKRRLKRTLALLAVVTMVVGLVACGSSGSSSEASSAASAASSAVESSTVAQQSSDASSEVSTAESGTEEKTRTVVDLAGRTVTIPENVERVGALCGPVYETIIMLGGVDQVVITGNAGGGKSWSHVICPEYADIPVTEDADAPNVEELIRLGTQVVFYWDNLPDVIQELEDAGIAVVVTQLADDGIDTPEEFIDLKKKEISLVGEVLGGDCVQEAADWCAYADEVCEKITSRTSTLDDASIPSVYYIRGPEALSIHGGESYTYYLVTMAGGDLVSKEDKELLYTTTMEQVMNWNPEYIFMGRVNNVELVTEDPAWENIKAVKDGNVFINEHGLEAADYASDCFVLMEQIASDLHPDLFSDLDMVTEVKNFYKNFYEYDLTDDQANRILTYQEPEGE